MSEVVNRTVGVGSCYPHPDNYNQHSYEQIVALQESLRVFSQVRSIVVQDDGQGGYLIAAGEGIWTAAKREGLETLRADVIPTDWPSERVKAYLAADNELARLGDPDLSQLAALVEDVASVDETLARLAAGTEEKLRFLMETGPPSLDALADQYGEPGERDFWPFVKVQVSPETLGLYESLMAQVLSEDEAIKFERLMGAVDASVLGSGYETNAEAMG
jgi:hypothetical protein